MPVSTRNWSRPRGRRPRPSGRTCAAAQTAHACASSRRRMAVNEPAEWRRCLRRWNGSRRISMPRIGWQEDLARDLIGARRLRRGRGGGRKAGTTSGNVHAGPHGASAAQTDVSSSVLEPAADAFRNNIRAGRSRTPPGDGGSRELLRDGTEMTVLVGGMRGSTRTAATPHGVFTRRPAAEQRLLRQPARHAHEWKPSIRRGVFEDAIARPTS